MTRSPSLDSKLESCLREAKSVYTSGQNQPPRLLRNEVQGFDLIWLEKVGRCLLRPGNGRALSPRLRSLFVTLTPAHLLSHRCRAWEKWGIFKTGTHCIVKNIFSSSDFTVCLFTTWKFFVQNITFVFFTPSPSVSKADNRLWLGRTSNTTLRILPVKGGYPQIRNPLFAEK